MLVKQTVTKNSIYFLSSAVIQKAMTLLYFILVARSFGPLEQGRYSSALAFTTFFGVFIDWGLASALVRESARSTRELISLYASQMFLARLAFGIVVYGIMIASAHILGYSPELVSLIVIAGIAAVIDVITTSAWSILRGTQNLKYESIGGIIAIAVMIAIGSAAIVFRMPVRMLVIAVMCGSIANLIYVLWIMIVRARFALRLHLHFDVMKKMFIIALPFAGAALFSRIYTFTDTLFVARLAGEQAAGWYAAGNKLILALNMFPGALSASLYPAMSSFFVSSRDRIGSLLERSIVSLVLLSMPLAVGIGLLSPQIVTAFYGNAYAPTIGTLQLLMPGLVFGFLAFPLGALLAATDEQRLNTLTFGIAAAVSVTLNVILIPRLSSYGAALAFSSTYVVIFSLSMYFTRQFWLPIIRHIGSPFAKIIMSSCVLAGFLLLVRDVLPLFASAVSGAALYAALLLLTRCITREAIRDSLQLFKKSQ